MRLIQEKIVLIMNNIMPFELCAFWCLGGALGLIGFI